MCKNCKGCKIITGEDADEFLDRITNPQKYYTSEEIENHNKFIEDCKSYYNAVRWSTKKYIPKEKIDGQRFGQLIWNAISRDYNDNTLFISERHRMVSDKLWNIENDELEKLIREFLKDIDVR